MLTVDACSTQDVDRLLSLADQFLDDWAEDAVQGGKPDHDYEERSAEWKVARPLLLSAPAMFKGLNEIVSVFHGSSNPIAMSAVSLARTALFGLRQEEGA